ncbi:jg4118 [Pararge aegeria aegeria]|uniref:Jg4118 protein n=1 Tax=Pararge aegeria aegeria TaxID=348720 RepID=A0A8S4RRV0_9NEOP|nr:jg4118 [Pararge aegeria aegeria]
MARELRRVTGVMTAPANFATPHYAPRLWNVPSYANKPGKKPCSYLGLKPPTRPHHPLTRLQRLLLRLGGHHMFIVLTAGREVVDRCSASCIAEGDTHKERAGAPWESAHNGPGHARVAALHLRVLASRRRAFAPGSDNNSQGMQGTRPTSNRQGAINVYLCPCNYTTILLGFYY